MRTSRHTPQTCAGVVARARQLANEPGSDDKSLVEAFVARNEHAAFALIVQRHGPMVLRVCRRVLGDRHAAEDAFQGTFLILAQRAKRIRNRASLAGWLHGTALRVAAAARRAAARHRPHESPDTRASAEPSPALVTTWHEVQALVDQEVQALPVIYREAFVRCCLEHASSAEVARELGVSEPTIRNRLARARKRLQGRLGWRGISLGTVVAMLAASAAEAVPAAPLVASTAAAACALAAGRDLTALAVREPVRSLVAGASRNVLLTKLKVTVGVLALCTALCAFAAGEPGDQPNPPVNRPLAGAKPAVPNPAAAAELANLEGTWVAEASDGVYFCVFAGSKCTTINATKKQAKESRVEVDPTQSPKWLNLTGAGEPTAELIYELKGDTLRVAVPIEQVRTGLGGVPHATRSPRPTELKDVDWKSSLLTFKRLTPAVEPPATRPRVAPPEIPSAHAEGQDVPLSVLVGQVAGKKKQMQAAEERLTRAQRDLQTLARIPANQVPRAELDRAQVEQTLADAELKVCKAELAEAETKLAAAFAKMPPLPGPPPMGSTPASKPPEPKVPEAKGAAPPPIKVTSRTLHLPVTCDPSLKDVREIQIYISDDSGKTWQLVAQFFLDATQTEFKVKYVAPRDGEYAFASRTIKADGTATPPKTTDLVADVRFSVCEPPPSDARTTPAPKSTAFDELYGLKDDEAVKLVPHTPTALTVRDEYLAKTGNKHLADRAITFTFNDRKAIVDHAWENDRNATGMELESLIHHVVPEISTEHLVCSPLWRTRRLAVDCVVRRDAKLEDRVAGLSRALSGVLGEPIALELREGTDATTIVSGKFKAAPRPWRPNGEIDVYALEKVVDKKLSPLGDYSAGQGDLRAFLVEVCRLCGHGREIVWEGVKDAPDRIKWYIHARDLGRGSPPKEDRDLEAVLKNVSEQTGLTFKFAKPKTIVLKKLSAK